MIPEEGFVFVSGDPDGFLDGDQFQVSWGGGDCTSTALLMWREMLRFKSVLSISSNFTRAGAMNWKVGGVGKNGYAIGG